MPSLHAGQGLTGVILCGPGASLFPLTSPTKLPKPLLPIANKPMIQYALEWLQEGGITTVVIVCMSEHEAALTSYIKSITEKGSTAPPSVASAAALSSSAAGTKQSSAKPLLNSKPAIVATPKQTSSTQLGTAAVLRLPQVRSHIKSDFILLPCDIICEVPLGVLINHWMAQQTSYGEHKGPLGVYYETGPDKGLERDAIVTSPIPSHPISKANPNFPAKISKLSTLLVPLGQKPEGVKLRSSLIEAHPRLSIHSTLRSAHVFIFPLWVLKFIAANPYKKLQTVRDDVVELLAKASWQGRGELARKLELFDILSDEGHLVGAEGHDGEADDDELKLFNLDAHREDITSYSTMRQSSASVLKRQAIRDVNTRGWAPDGSAVAEALPTAVLEREEAEDYFKISFKPKEPMYNGFYIPPFSIFTPDMEIEPLSTKPLVRRVDSIPLYLSTSLEIARNSPPSQPISISADIHQRCTVTPNDCIVGDNCVGEEKSLIKRSVLGQNVTVSKLARVNGCIILEGVTIGESSKLEGCVVGRYAKIGKSCTLVGCEIEEGAVVDDHVEGKNERFEFEEDNDDDSTFDDDDDDNALETESESSEEDETPLSPRTSKLAASQQKEQQQGESKDDKAEEEEEEPDSDFEPSEDSSFCAEEFNSEYESDEADDAAAHPATPAAAASAEDTAENVDEKKPEPETLLLVGTQETEAA